MKNIDVLCLEWPGNERDIYAVAPIIKSLRECGYECVTGDIFNYAIFFIKYKPKILLISNFQGATINSDVCKLAHIMGIKVYSLIAEGNFRPGFEKQFLWGHNKSEYVYFDKLFLWSERTKKMSLTINPELKDKIVVSGNVAADRYKLLKFANKKDFLKEQFDLAVDHKVVGIAGWGFDRLHETKFYRDNEQHFLNTYGYEQILRFRSDFKKLKKIYHDLISENPKYIFILRLHPGLTNLEYNEFLGLEHFENVYISQPRKCKYSISDLISVSDIWSGYETTSCLEAWLLEKHTFLVNPSGGDFIRDNTADGSIKFREVQQVENYITLCENVEFKLDDVKRKIINDVVGGSDGCNHNIPVKYISESLMETSNVNYNRFGVVKKLGFKPMIHLFRNSETYTNIRKLRKSNDKQIEDIISKFYVEDYE
ncbi:BFO_1060 family glycosyltransferase [Vibrio splendidus]